MYSTAHLDTTWACALHHYTICGQVICHIETVRDGKNILYSCRETGYFSTVHLLLNKSQVLHVVTPPLRVCLGVIILICFCFPHIFIPTIFFSASLSMSILFFPLSTLPPFLFASVKSKEIYISFLQAEILHSSAVIRIVPLHFSVTRDYYG